MNDSDQNERQHRVGLHPALVIFGVIIGLWIFIQAILPESKEMQPPQGHDVRPGRMAALLRKEAESAPAPPWTLTAHVEAMNAVGLLVPRQTTDSQVIALLTHLQASRANGSLSSRIPATTPGNTLDEFAVADVYIFSDPHYATAEVIHMLSVGAHAPGDFYQSAIPYEKAMERVRGHYAVNLNNQERPERATLGFGEEATGLYSKGYQPIL